MKLTFVSALLSATPALAQVSDATYAAIQKYTLFAAASYAETCPTPPSGARIVQFFNNTATDTQAYLFSTGSEQILSFRGSSSPQDLDTDFNFTLTSVTLPGVSCGACQVHQGFQGAVLSVLPAIQAALAPGTPLTLTGHSLGGALAAVAAPALKPAAVYTFGEPRNGNADWSAFVDSVVPPAQYFRVTHANDGVPQIPPVGLNYRHHGTEYWESLANGNSAASVKNVGTGEPTTGNAAQDYGQSPINGAHIQYTDVLVASMLNNPGCGFKNP